MAKFSLFWPYVVFSKMHVFSDATFNIRFNESFETFPQLFIFHHFRMFQESGRFGFPTVGLKNESRCFPARTVREAKVLIFRAGRFPQIEESPSSLQSCMQQQRTDEKLQQMAEK